MRWKTGIFLLLVAGLVTAAGQSPETVTITWSFWGSPEEVVDHFRVLQAFQASHLNIVVEVQNAPWASYFDRLTTQFAAGAAPDVMFMAPFYFNRVVGEGLLRPVDDLIVESNVDISNYNQPLLDIFRFQGQLYGFPRDNDTQVLFYNKDLLDAAGVPVPDSSWTWDTLRSAAQALTKREGDRTTQWSFATTQDQFILFPRSFGGDYFDDPINPTTFTLDDPPAIAGLQFMSDLINVDKTMVPFPAFSQIGGVNDLFATGRLALAITNLPASLSFRDVGFSWDVAPLPAGPGGRRVNSLGGAGFVINANASHLPEAWEFLRFLAFEGQALYAQAGTAVPALNTPEVAAAFAASPPANKAIAISEAQNGILNPQIPEFSMIRSQFIFPAVERIAIGDATPQEAMDAIAPQIEEILASQ
ncbi:MAG: sugar ABC transporter substrate-binding protein [Deinococcus sp.]|nr:sugar ABC transporter substrate-binding protein [Deinococcus sp.]